MSTKRVAGQRRDDPGDRGLPVEAVASDEWSRDRMAELASASADRLAAAAKWCVRVNVALAIFGWIGAIGILAEDPRENLGLAAILALAVTGSVLVIMVLCRWAIAYATDLAWRAF